MTLIPPPLERFVTLSQVPLTVAAPGAGGQLLLAVNDAFERLTGYGRSEIVGRDCRLLQGARSEATARKAMRDGLRDGLETCAVITNYRRDGTEFDNFVYLIPVFEGSGDTPVMTIGSQFEIGAENRVAAHMEHTRFLQAGLAELNAGQLGDLFIECAGLSDLTAQALVMHRIRNLRRVA